MLGYLATFVHSETTYVSGVYNGKATTAPSHRARIPASSSIHITNADSPIYALDLECAVFLKRSTVQGASVEQRWYAPYNTPALMVHEIEVNTSSSGATLTLWLNSGLGSTDIAFKDVDNPPTGTVFREGYTRVAEETDSETTGVSILYTDVPSTLDVEANTSTTFYFITAIRTTLDTNASILLDTTFQIYNAAVTNRDSLLNDHKKAWSKVWESGKKRKKFTEMTDTRQRFTGTEAEFLFTTTPSIDLPHILHRHLPTWEKVEEQRPRSLSTPQAILNIVDNGARARAMAMWLWTTDSVYHTINSAMLSDSPNDTLITTGVDNITAALAHACNTEPINIKTSTWRGINVNEDHLEEIFTNLKRPFSMKTFAATSTRRDVAKQFGSVILRFDGVPKKYLGDVSMFPSEREYLIPPWVKVKLQCTDSNGDYVLSPVE
ncbi:Endoribonuclease Dicer [Pelomyxa schiedti]|nr:Endoribonuclease Dicer [Pelomyxa schiedti]